MDKHCKVLVVKMAYAYVNPLFSGWNAIITFDYVKVV